MKIELLNSLAKVFPQEVIGETTDGGFMFSDELHHFGFYVCAEKDHHFPCSVVIGGELENYVKCYRTELIPSVLPEASNHDDYVLYNKSGVYPDALIECKEKDQIFPLKINVGFMAEVDGSKNIPAGEYEIKISVLDKDGGELANTVYNLIVSEEKLPESDLIVTQWIHYDSIAEQHNCEPFDDKFYSVCGEYFRTAVRYGQTMILTPLFTFALDTAIGTERKTFQLVGVKKNGKKYSFDFSELDKFISFALNCGFKYIEFSHLFTQWGALHAPKIMAEEDGEIKKIFGWETDSLGEEYQTFLSEFLPELEKFIDRKKLNGKCFIHLSDEPNAHAVERYGKLKESVKKYLKDVPIIDALSEYDFYEKGLVDMPAVATDHAQKFIDNKVAYFAYYCSAQGHSCLANRFFDMPSLRNRILGSQLYATGAKGFLHWGFNFCKTALSYFEIDPYKVSDAGGCLPSGDSFIVYPSGNGCIPSLRLFVFFDGLQDYKALKLLEKKKGKQFVLDMLDYEGVKGYTEYPRLSEWFMEFRQKINKLIIG